ncbi:hypothetical protein OG407_41500 [Streptomyces sp. NBC_01515]|uniref:hypothetical protein n=1 Tax=Streptomyces sp. NBC_01515 TaxID=2903890 RepID=UPI0038669739
MFDTNWAIHSARNTGRPNGAQAEEDPALFPVVVLALMLLLPERGVRSVEKKVRQLSAGRATKPP